MRGILGLYCEVTTRVSMRGILGFYMGALLVRIGVFGVCYSGEQGSVSATNHVGFFYGLGTVWISGFAGARRFI